MTIPEAIRKALGWPEESAIKRENLAKLLESGMINFLSEYENVKGIC